MTQRGRRDKIIYVKSFVLSPSFHQMKLSSWIRNAKFFIRATEVVGAHCSSRKPTVCCH